MAIINITGGITIGTISSTSGSISGVLFLPCLSILAPVASCTPPGMLN